MLITCSRLMRTGTDIRLTLLTTSGRSACSVGECSHLGAARICCWVGIIGFIANGSMLWSEIL